MTPSEIETFARRRYNAVGDNTWSQEEIFDLIYDAQMEMARYSKIIENRYSASTVSSQREYVMPSRALGIKRIEVDGEKIQFVTMREDDTLRLINSTITVTGVPRYYFVFDDSIFFSPTPGTNGTDNIDIFTFDKPNRVTVSTPIDIPELFHVELAHYVVGQMALKDLNLSLADRQEKRWKDTLIEARKWQRRKQRGDSFTVVQNEETFQTTVAGLI